MSDCITIEYTQKKVIEVRDVDGKPIQVGSVLRRTDEDCHGVVIKIIKPGDYGDVFTSVGDIHIQLGRGKRRVTNCYSEWQHVPHNEQTYQERLLSWKYRPYKHDDYREISEDEGLAVDGIMSLLPDDMVDWEFGPWPDRIDDALGFLVAHLDELTKSGKENSENGK